MKQEITTSRVQERLAGVKTKYSRFSAALTNAFAPVTGEHFKTKIRLAGKMMLPALAAFALNLGLHGAVFAQGPIFTGNSNNLSNIIRVALILFSVLLFCAGALGVGLAIWNKMFGKEWTNYAVGGLCSFAFGTIVAVIYAVSQGQDVTIDTNF